MIDVKGKPRGRNGGRKKGSKDKAPRAIRAEPSKLLAVRVPENLMYRIERQASLEGDPVPVFVRNLLDREVV